MTGDWQVPGYRWIRDLGEGSAGRVVLAVHAATDTPVAIKYLSQRMLADEEFVTRFRAEARLLAGIYDPNLVRFHEYVESINKNAAPGDPPRGAAIVMELVDGVSLVRLIKQEGPTGPEAALAILKGSLLGLAAAHSAGVVHRDYKPGNILIRGDGASKLSDFGIAVRAGDNVPAAGTPAYMPPEQWAGRPVTPASDVYAATAVFFECLTGFRPFRGRTLPQLALAHRTAQVPIEQVPEALRGLVGRGMAKAAHNRPQSAMAFLDELETTALAAYGPNWEERGRNRLAEIAALLALLFPLAEGTPETGSAVAQTVLGAGGASTARRLVYTIAAATVVLVLGSGGILAYTVNTGYGIRAVATGKSGSLFESSVVIPNSTKASKGKHPLMSVYVCGPEIDCPPSNAERLDSPPGSGPPPASSQRTLKAGGRIRATLKSPGPEVQVRQTGDQIQPLRSRSDWVSWNWSVTGNKPGTYVLVLGLTVLKGETSEALYPTRYYSAHITITVTHTAGGAIKAAGSALQKIATSFQTVAVGLGALGISFSLLVKRWRRRRRDNDNDANLGLSEAAETADAAIHSNQNPMSATTQEATGRDHDTARGR